MKINLLFIVFCLFFFSYGKSNAQFPIERKRETNLSISLQSYSFNKLLNDKIKGRGNGISLYELMDFAAENKFDAIEITGYFFPGYPEIPTDEFIYSVKKHAFQLGLEISGTGVKNDFANPDPELRAKDVKHVKEWIDVATKLGAPVLRIFSGNIPEGYENKWDEILVYMAASIKECAEYGQSKGVLLAVQNHGDFLKTADETIKLVKLVDSDWFGVVVDTGYFLTDDPYVDMEKVMPYAFSFLLKEGPVRTDPSIKTDLPRIMKILHQSEFRGYVPIETLSPKKSAKVENTATVKQKKYDPYTAVPEFLKDVRAAIQEEFKMN